MHFSSPPKKEEGGVNFEETSTEWLKNIWSVSLYSSNIVFGGQFPLQSRFFGGKMNAALNAILRQNAESHFHHKGNRNTIVGVVAL